MGIGLPQAVNPPNVLAVFDAYAHPDVWGPFDNPVQFLKTLRSLRQHLILMPVGLVHYVEDPPDVFDRNCLVEKIAHGVYENALRPLYSQWFIQLLGDELQVETLFERMPGTPAKALRESLGVQVLAPLADFDAAADRVPRRVGPLDGRRSAHGGRYTRQR